MTTKDLLKAEIEALDEETLDELYKIVKKLSEAKKAKHQAPSFMSRLKDIKIDAPEDFSTNLDQYTSAEKRID